MERWSILSISFLEGLKQGTRLFLEQYEQTKYHQQQTYSTQVQLRKSVNFFECVGVPYRSRNKKLFTGTRVTQRQLHHHKLHPNMNKDKKNPQPWCSLYNLLAARMAREYPSY